MEKRYEIGNFIYRLRTERGYTQKELGALLGVTDKAVSKWETGAALPRRAVFERLAELLGCTQEELLQGKRLEKAPEKAVLRNDNALTAGNERRAEESDSFRKKIRMILCWAELCVVLVFVILSCVLGFHKGIWDGSTFLSVKRDGTRHIYAGKDVTVEVAPTEDHKAVILCSKNGQSAQLLFRSVGSGESEAVFLSSAEGSLILSRTFYHREEAAAHQGTGHIVSEHLWNTDRFMLDISDEAICRMALGYDKTRIGGRSRDFLVAAGLSILGFLLPILSNAVLRLDKKLLGVFYRNTAALRANGIAQGILTVLGVLLFCTGLVLWWSVALA